MKVTSWVLALAIGCGARSDLDTGAALGEGEGPWIDGSAAQEASTLDATAEPSDDVSEVDATPHDAGVDGDATVCGPESLPPATAYWAEQSGAIEPWSATGEYLGSYVPNAMAVDAAGNVVVVGSFRGVMTLGGTTLSSAPVVYANPMYSYLDAPYSEDVFVAKFDPDGKVLFAKAYGDGSPQAARAVALDAAGDIYVAGAYAGAINFGGATLDTGVSLDPTMEPASEVFVVELDPEGEHVWSQSFGAPSGSTTPRGISVDSQGNVVLSGSFATLIAFGADTFTTQPNDIGGFLAKRRPERRSGPWVTTWASSTGTERCSGAFPLE